MSPSSFLVRSHMRQESSIHVRNRRNRDAISRIQGSSSLTTLLRAGWGGTSIRRQCDILRTSKCFKPSKMMSRASLLSSEHRRLNTFNFGRQSTSVEAHNMSHGPMILSLLKFLQFLEISSMMYRGLAMLGIVKDSRSFHTRMALHIPVFFILFQAGRTSRLSFGHLRWRQGRFAHG